MYSLFCYHIYCIILLMSSLHNWAVFLYASQGTWPCFHWICISFLPLSFTSGSRHSHDNLLPSFPDFLHLRIKDSCTLWSSQRPSSLFCSLVPEGSFPGDSPINLLLEQLEVFSEVQDWLYSLPDFTLCLTHIPQDGQVHHCVMTAATLQSRICHTKFQ